MRVPYRVVSLHAESMATLYSVSSIGEIPGTAMPPGSESAQHRFDWQSQTQEETPPDMVGVKPQGISAHCTSIINEYAAMINPEEKPMKVYVFMTGSTATGMVVVKQQGGELKSHGVSCITSSWMSLTDRDIPDSMLYRFRAIQAPIKSPSDTSVLQPIEIAPLAQNL
jgi:hypothetical protein